MRKLLLFLFALALLFGCKSETGKVAAIDLNDMDLSVSPGEDFYRYANGGWMERNPLKPEYASFGSFDVLRVQNEERLNELFAGMAKSKPKAGTVNQKISDLYKQGLDSLRLNEEGGEPVRKYLDAIYAVSDMSELVEELALENKYGDGGFFSIGAQADLMDSKTQVLYLGQVNLGMGDRDYYTEAENAELKAGYVKMLEKLFSLSGYENPEQRAANALKVEDLLAEVSWTNVQNRDVLKLYNPMSTAEICETWPALDFARFLSLLGIPEQDKIVVAQPSFFDGLNKVLQDVSLEELKDYMAAGLLVGASSSMSDEYYDAIFDFYSTQMSGVTEKQPRWKRAMRVPNSLLGEAVGQMYVQKYFPEEYKNQVLTLVNQLQLALSKRIDSLAWMSDETKQYAQEKLSTFRVKIGYPDEWKDYSTLEVDPNLSYYENLRNASAWYVADNLSKIGQPTDPEEWHMSPQTVNAYYNPTTNEICFPAAILQPPFFNPHADDAVNYGAIGVVIGHEMTHGFDDQGRIFDKDGNMTNWWTPEDEAAFKERTVVLGKQFDEVEILPGLFANGDLTMGENIADQGGLNVAWDAYLNSVGGELPEPIDGFTAPQRFLIGYARLWASNSTDEHKAQMTVLDPHSLPQNRVNVTLRNISLYYEAFDVSEDDPMYRPVEERIEIW